jgi:dihydroflavonol-4-reductase
VRGTVRSLANEAKVKHLRDLYPGSVHKLELVEADLTSPKGWPEAVAGAEFVLHLASPFPLANPKHEDELIKPAVEGTLTVLRACAAATPRPRRVVVTSSVAAVAYGYSPRRAHTYSEADWTNLADPTWAPAPYVKSKTLAERAAWDFLASLPAEQRFEMATINPGLVLGPTLSGVHCTSAEILEQFLLRKMPGVPDIQIGVVDVRAVARAHLLAMTLPQAAGQRFLAVGAGTTSGVVGMSDIAGALAAEFNPLGYRVPTGRLPTWLLKVAGLFDSTAAVAAQNAGAPLSLDNSKIRTVLGVEFPPLAVTVSDMAHSLIATGMVPDKTADKRLSAAKPVPVDLTRIALAAGTPAAE